MSHKRPQLNLSGDCEEDIRLELRAKISMASKTQKSIDLAVKILRAESRGEEVWYVCYWSDGPVKFRFCSLKMYGGELMLYGCREADAEREVIIVTDLVEIIAIRDSTEGAQVEVLKEMTNVAYRFEPV